MPEALSARLFGSLPPLVKTASSGRAVEQRRDLLPRFRSMTGAFADDQLGLMDPLGVHQFVFFGNCIGGSFAPS